jgi:hypothetical protein
MTEVFRKHYSYGETIPILDTNVGMIADIYEVSDKPATSAPYIKAVFVALAGPMKSLPLIVEPLDNESKVVHIPDIPVPIQSVRTVDLSLIFDIANYRWMASPDVPRDNGLITFDLRLRAAFSLLNKSYTLLLDQRPCAITLTRLPQQQMPLGAGTSFDQTQQSGAPSGGQAFGPTTEFGSVPYARSDQRWSASGPNGSEASSIVTNQLEVEERLRQLSAKMLVRS